MLGASEISEVGVTLPWRRYVWRCRYTLIGFFRSQQ